MKKCVYLLEKNYDNNDTDTDHETKTFKHINQYTSDV